MSVWKEVVRAVQMGMGVDGLVQRLGVGADWAEMVLGADSGGLIGGLEMGG